MQMQDALALIEQTKCHPFTITARREAYDLSIRITLEMDVRNIHDPDHTFPLQFHRHLSEIQLSVMDEAMLIEALWKHIEWAVIHEAAEQFTVKGERPKAPEH